MIDNVDVIIPTYNRAKTIDRSIRSVLDQTYKNLVLYVIDDCSTDDTEKTVHDIKDNRVKYFRNDKRRGANYCRNLGVKYSNAKYIAFNDSDDIWHPNKIETQMNIIGDRDAMVFSPYLLHENNKTICMGKCSEDEIENIHRRLLRNNVIGTPTILITRDLFTRIGWFDEQMKRFQDWEFCLRASEREMILYCNEILVDAYRREDSITSNSVSAFDSLYSLTDAYLDEIIKYDLIEEWIDIYIHCGLSNDEILRMFLLFDISETRVVEMLINTLNRINNLRVKSDEYLDITANLLSKSGKIVSYFKAKQIKQVCVYGNSVMGDAIGHLLINNHIEVISYIDKNTDKYCFCKLIHPNDYNMEGYPDVIINTVPSIDPSIKTTFPLSRVITISELMDI